MSIGYAKLFNSILDSSIWQECNETRILWITMLAMADKGGDVQASIPGLAKRAGITIPECETGLKTLLSPDPYSRTTDFEGRRIIVIDGGWNLLNHNKYRALLSAEERREYNRRKKAESREKERSRKSKEVNDMSMTVIESQHCQHITDTDTDADCIEGTKVPSHSDFAEVGKKKARIPKKSQIEGFSEFWQAYPKRIGRGAAEKAFVKAVKRVSLTTMIEAINRQSQSEQWQKEDGQFIPNPATWLNQERWGDEMTTSPAKQPIRTGAIQAPEGWQAIYATIEEDPIYIDGEYSAPEWDRLLPAEKAEVIKRINQAA